MNSFFGNLIYIENGKNYEPGKEVFKKNEQYIVALHLTRTLQGNVTLTNLVHEKIEFPPTAFVPGGVYNFPITKVEYSNPDDDKAFVGCRFGYRSF